MYYTKLSEMKKIPELKPYAKYLIYGSGVANLMMNFIPLTVMESQGWNLDSMNYGLERLIAEAEKGSCIYPVHTPEACKADRKNRDVNVIYLPAGKKKENSPYVILIAGGAYTSVCSLVEAYPVAARLNEMGYDAFCLTYHVGGKGMMPKPMDDLAAAVRYIMKNEDKFGVKGSDYIVCGFSAGANVTAIWGTANHGYKAYGLPKPRALFPIYVPIGSKYFKADDKLTENYLTTCFGKNRTPELVADYDVDTNADADYPPTYLCCNKDDPLVDYHNSEDLKKVLDELEVPCILEEGESGGHGFGEGRGLQVEKWYERAMAFAMEER